MQNAYCEVLEATEEIAKLIETNQFNLVQDRAITLVKQFKNRNELCLIEAVQIIAQLRANNNLRGD